MILSPPRADGLDVFGRSLHFDHVRYFGLGRTLVCMFPERTAVYVMRLPDVVMGYSQGAQVKWLKQVRVRAPRRGAGLGVHGRLRTAGHRGSDYGSEGCLLPVHPAMRLPSTSRRGLATPLAPLQRAADPACLVPACLTN